uniref:E3 ubiquitin-protein ligase TRIM39-like n=1 Tax=Astyanax mexicanus TaxID=7994 RepID=A0A3B1JVM8_ASTMX
MAEFSLHVLSEDQFLCSICLDMFTDPVSTPCGHNFCMNCIKTCWGDSQQCNCPLCKEKFTKRPELKVNTTLREVRNTENEISDSVEVFTALIHCIERSQAELLEVMVKKQKAAERQAEEFIKDLEQEITDLKRRDTELEQLSHTEDPLHLLQIYPSLCRPPHTTNWTDISVDAHLSVETVRNALSQLQKSLNEELTKNLNEKIRESVDVTLDPDTAYPKLNLSDDGKQVSCGDKEQNLPDNQKRFTNYGIILGKEGFCSGRFYYEVQVREKTYWQLGVARESVNRKGETTVNPQNGFWAVDLRNENEYKAFAGPPVCLSLRENLQKVGVFVDYEEGLVSFYDVDARSHIYSFTGQSFTDKLYPYFCPGLNSGGKNSAPLIISPVSNTD